MATPKKRSTARRAAPAKKRSARKAPARKRTPRKGAPKRAAAKQPAKKAAAKKSAAKRAGARQAQRRSKVDKTVLEYTGMSGTPWTCTLAPGAVKGVANSYEEAVLMAKPGEGPTWSDTRPTGVGKPKLGNKSGKMVMRAAAEEQPECCYYINGKWVCW